MPKEGSGVWCNSFVFNEARRLPRGGLRAKPKGLAAFGQWWWFSASPLLDSQTTPRTKVKTVQSPVPQLQTP